MGSALGFEAILWGNTDKLRGRRRPYVHTVGVAPVDGDCSSHIFVIRSRAPEWFGSALGQVPSFELVTRTDAASAGTKTPRTSWSDTARYEVALPPMEVAAAFAERIRPLVERIISNIHESRTLSALRDALLSKRLSGRLRVGKEA